MSIDWHSRRREPNEWLSHNERGRVHMDRGENERALADFRKAHELGSKRAGDALRKLGANLSRLRKTNGNFPL
jgi:hypothetical protein